MTHTIQPLCQTAIEIAENTVKKEEEKNTCDILAVCDSLNKLYETLSRLEYAIRRKNIEINLKRKSREESDRPDD